MKRILIVDDMEQNRYVLEATLRGYGYEVVTSHNGTEALAAARAQPPDLVISDILMPVMDGFALCRAWQADERLRRIPFIFYTATYTDPKDEQLALDLGADRFVVKPQEPQVMHEIVRAVLASGAKTAGAAFAKVRPDEIVTLREYNEVLVRKLEKKLTELETAHQQLVEDMRLRKETEATLRQSEERYRQLFAASPDAMFVLDHTGRFLDCNETAVQRYGYSRAELLQMSAPDLAAPDLREKAAAQVKGALATGVVFEWRHRRKDGSELPVEIGAKPFEMGGQTLGLSSVRDITERRQAAEALRESETRLRLVLDGLGSQMFVGLLDRDGVVLVANRPALEAAGLRMEDVLGHPVHETYWFTYSDAVVRKFRAAVQRATQGETVRYDEQIRVAEGRLVWVAFTVNPLRDEAGKVVFLVPSAVVIEERKQAEAALRASYDRLKKVLEVETVGVMFWDLTTGCMTDANDTFLKTMGYSRADVESRSLTWQRLTPPEYVETSLAEVRKFQATGRVGPYEKEYLRKDGTRQWFVFAGSSLGNNSCVEFCVDISDRKQAEAALRESEARLQLSAQAGNVGLWDWDLKTSQIFFSREWKSQIGYRDDEVSNDFSEWQSRVHPDDLEPTLRKVTAFVADPKGRHEGEFRFRHKDGSYRWIHTQADVLRDTDGKPARMLGCHIDVTERRQAEEELRGLSGRLLRVQDDERRRLARELHDQTAQHLAAVAMNLSSLQRLAPDLPAKAGALLGDTQALTQRAAQEVRTLSYLLHSPVLEDVGLVAAVRDYATGLAKRSGVGVGVEADPAFGRLSHETELALFRVVQESLANILKHSGSSTATVCLTQDAEEICLEVRDEGQGFGAGSLSPPGTLAGDMGVGIAGMRERMRQLGGRLQIDSGPRGTTVRATLPGAKER